MKARRTARKLALFALFQLEKQGKDSYSKSQDKKTIQELILNSVRVLSDQATEMIQDAVQDLTEVSHSILALEMEHPDNLVTPFDADMKPVPIPTTREMAEKIDKCLMAAEYLAEAMHMPEFYALANASDVETYVHRLIEAVINHQQDVDNRINQCAQEWRVDRLARMDRAILRLAVGEMQYIEDVDLSVSINEAIELAKIYSTEESYRFINGLLGKVAEELEMEKGAGKTPIAEIQPGC